MALHEADRAGLVLVSPTLFGLPTASSRVFLKSANPYFCKSVFTFARPGALSNGGLHQEAAGRPRHDGAFQPMALHEATGAGLALASPTLFGLPTAVLARVP
jgi:hypothetical protein